MSGARKRRTSPRKTPAIISFHSSRSSGLVPVASEKPAYAIVMVARKSAAVLRRLASPMKSNAILPPAHAGRAHEIQHHEGGEPDD